MKTNKATKIIESALSSLIQSIENGQNDTLRAYLQTMSRFHNYSLNNIMLIATQRPVATRVAGFHAWRKLGRYVMKGEKGIAIVAPMISKKDCIDQSDDSTHDVFGFKVVYVFDVAQTGGQDLPTFSSVEGDPQLIGTRLNKLIAHLGIFLQYSDNLDYDGVSTGGKIIIKTGLTPAHDFAVRVHELAHEMLHTSNRSSLSKKQKETEAEATAFVVCNWIGLNTNTACSDYIQTWSGDKKTLLDSFQRIKETSSRIISELE